MSPLRSRRAGGQGEKLLPEATVGLALVWQTQGSGKTFTMIKADKPTVLLMSTSCCTSPSPITESSGKASCAHTSAIMRSWSEGCPSRSNVFRSPLREERPLGVFSVFCRLP